jgi:hypothetical protein
MFTGSVLITQHGFDHAAVFLTDADHRALVLATRYQPIWKKHGFFRDMLQLLTDELDQDAFPAAPVKLSVKDLFPRAKVKPPIGDRHNYFAPHHLPFQMRIPVIFAGPVVAIVANRFVGGQTFQPFLIVGEQALLIIVYKNRGRNVHGVNERQAIVDAALA